VCSLAERHRPAELDVGARLNQGIVVLAPRKVRLEMGHASCREVGSSSGPRKITYTRPAWLVVDDKITDRSFDLTDIGAREVIPLLREVIVDRAAFVREHHLHEQENLPRQEAGGNHQARECVNALHAR
jgi:hypothetical protein